ncbi:MAG TPA: CRISPR-associated endonuclease Cas3'', partial [Cytophagales bacterium]|nr:CRISPR-associated endonuclease Cas3'' [Cytophagales bacterium]
MESLNEILAKSKNYGNLTLLDHTRHVTQAIELFAQKYAFDFNIEIARKGAILHDLGKAHPYFQRKIQNINAKTLKEKRELEYVHRHEISSLAFLPCFSAVDWNDLIDLVIGHHKSIQNDPGGRGIIDLVERDRNFIENHLKDWDDWSSYAIQILQAFELPVKRISKDEARKALNYVALYCERKKHGFSPLRGLLKSADHFASAFMDR